jgi:hypothetical protein
MYCKIYRSIGFFTLLLFLEFNCGAQLKFLVDDFEGMANGSADLKTNGFFSFGNIKTSVESGIHSDDIEHHAYAGNRAFKAEVLGKGEFGGWGKGLSVCLELDQQQDYINFYINYQDAQSTKIKIEIQEDDNNSHVYEKEMDDAWTYMYNPEIKKGWQLVSIPLSKFKDGNTGGDGTFNIGYKTGKLFCLLMSFDDPAFLKSKHVLFLDFICFSKGALPVGSNLFDAPVAASNSFCALGAWSGEGNSANFVDIATVFENNFKPLGKKLGVVHFFQSYAFDGGTQQNHYPSVERINKVIKAGYVPMITLEDHFVNAHPGTKQPNLYSIVEGHFDSFFGYWASQIKEVDGTVMLRILHEFNGDWYPWCTANNDKDPQLVAKAYRYIINIFRQNNVNNVKLIWCPNSMSVPQESWNYIMEAYPGDDYVDFVGLDIYNGAGSGKGVSQWRSFRKEGIENYFVLTEKLPFKPLFICETASRERRPGEPGQTKAEWIRDMSVALKTDMSKIKLLEWFDEKETFKVNSSEESKNAFKQYIMKDDFFTDGTKNIIPLFSH